MSRPALTTFQRLRILYKANSFPWKKHVMVGWDLDGNEYWEMPDPNNPGGRWKRWVQMKDDDIGLFEENKLPVQWQAWLRHTRYEAPTIEELLKEQRRRQLLQQRVRQLQLEEQEEKKKLEASSARERNQHAASSHAAPEEARKDQDTTEPMGHGETFTPGQWTPTSRR
ncbi:hypothetical protein VTP01DRAFT_1019 [Rhizomucor pusillus]|uniref:uncharacterized protein n=1 Tax=Rhizomucor pusillus TaxID=4840 RepID=UPI003742FB1B